MENAVSYVRVSSDDQAKHGFSISQQITNNMDFALKNGYKIVKTFKDEGFSAKNLNRPGLQSLLEYCSDKKNKVKAVIIWKLDRISRNVGDYTATLIPFFVSNDIELLTVTDANGEGLQVEAMRQVAMVFAEFERKTGAIRTKEGIRGKVATGQYPNHPPYGYKNIEKPGSRYKEMVLDEENAFFVRQAFTMCLNGDSSRTIASKLFASNVQNQNANVDEHSFGGRMGEVADEVLREYALNHLMSKIARDNHLNNEIYIHDLSHYALGDHNCLSIPFDDLLAKGFNTRQTDVRPANSINTAFQLVAVIFQLQSLMQFGGVAATHLDWTMVPYVRKSFYKHYSDGLLYYADEDDVVYFENVWNQLNKKIEEIPINDSVYRDCPEAYKYAMDKTIQETHQAVEGMYHNLNTLQSRSGN